MVQHDQDKQLLCLDRLIQDLQQLTNDHQTADIIFIVDNHHNETNNEITKIDDNDDHQNTETIYAHRLILRARMCSMFFTILG
ncbi:hypothetical protein BLA29_013892 [Euroglyphus maynei]|uniref:BTB domain-containing protein n=1 Tax=Euroglyphus maynei TaxID=6958 RepID=A0A1Y3AU17_EURMA|nr:hypothetical protein BLA29_013892 [Euroglyphus maynei]